MRRRWRRRSRRRRRKTGGRRKSDLVLCGSAGWVTICLSFPLSLISLLPLSLHACLSSLPSSLWPPGTLPLPVCVCVCSLPVSLSHKVVKRAAGEGGVHPSSVAAVASLSRGWEGKPSSHPAQQPFPAQSQPEIIAQRK